ncbi:glycosyltransferase family 2 protein [Nakamurella antarctica]|uniref:4,4'-diaponeurosporenoate glycosyltransferase n=1 Tax=Nakamurella antarctica TaxID=1902245 RepID=A0A3G8ZN43_9ACTN|nr:glycosyltransferase [Nakamurella antarctica]AZI58673.1 glycosyltransferase family 2 protein [Nakamurella antarctica]
MTSWPGTRAATNGIAVVIPARNEADRLGRSLEAVLESVDDVRSYSDACVRIVLVLDSCTDASADIAAAFGGVDILECELGVVGAVRHVGARYACELLGDDGWIACTDADSVVPARWLRTHLEAASAGFDMLLGTVRPDPDELQDHLLRRWRDAHLLIDGHPHVHGANLGISNRMYRTSGGFAAVQTHEDALLAEAVQGLGGRILRTGESPVLTSARMTGRAPAGMAAYLTNLSQKGA